MNHVGAVVVTYWPDPAQLRSLLDSLAAQADWVCVVDNGGLPADWPAGPRCDVIRNPGNLGIAAAINQGVAALSARGCRWFWTLDQDSLPAPDCLAHLLRAGEGPAPLQPVAAIAPCIVDLASDAPLPLLQLDAEGRIHKAAPDRRAHVAAAIASGMLIPAQAWAAIGGMDEAFFIDHVDTEWCFRAQARGFAIVYEPAAMLHHRLGTPARAGWPMAGRIVKVRNAQRTYTILRNGWAMRRMAHVPPGWKTYFRTESAKLMLKALVWGPDRIAQMGAVYRAARDARRPR